MLLSHSLTLIADTSPDSPFSWLVVGQAINDRGQVAFVADLKSGGEAIYRTADDGRLTTIAQTNGLIRDFYLSPYVNDSGTVVFGADLTDGTQALFTGTGDKLTRIADTGPDSPISSLPPPAARIGSDGTVCFQALLSSGGKGFFIGHGRLLSILYVTGGRYSAFPGSPASQIHGDTVVFRATLTGGPDGVFRGDGLHTDTIVTADDTYSSFLGSEINDEGTVGIIANLNLPAGGQAIVIAKDGMPLTTFVDTSGPFSHFAEGKLSISNQEGAVIGADLAAGGTGIFDGPDPVADKILATGDKVFGSTVIGFPVNYMNPRALNNAGQVIFRANLADGRTVLVRADPDGASPAAGRRPGTFDVFVKLTAQDVLSVSVGTAGELHSPSGFPSALSNLPLGEGELLAQRGKATPSQDHVKAGAQLRAALPASSGSVRSGAHDHIFADFQRDWLSDTLVSDLVIAA